MKKMLMIALLVPFVGLQAENASKPELPYRYSKDRLNLVNNEWVKDLNNSGLPWNDRDALRALFDGAVEYARFSGKNKQYITTFNDAVRTLRERIPSHSKGALVRGLRQSERLDRINKLLSRLDARWFNDDLAGYALGQVGDEYVDALFIKEQLKAFNNTVRQLQSEVQAAQQK